MTARNTSKSSPPCCRVFVHMAIIFLARSMPRWLRVDMSHSLANKTTTQQHRHWNITSCMFSDYAFFGVFIIQRITIQRPGIHRCWHSLSADEHCSSSSMAIIPASFATESIIETFPNRVAVLIHGNNSSAGAGDSMLRLQWTRTRLCFFLKVFFQSNMNRGDVLLTESFPVALG